MKSEKNAAGVLHSMAHLNMEAHEIHVPLDKCKLYPGIPMRFEMDLERLMESIRARGQLEPAMAVKQGEYYLIPEGRRRLLACRYSRYHFGGPEVLWVSVYEQLDEVKVFTQAFIKNDEKKYFSLLEEVTYFREANKRFGAKVATEIGFRASREPGHMRKVLGVCGWIESKPMKLHKIEVITEYRFTLSDLENLFIFRSEDKMFYQAAAAVAAARLMNPAQVDPGEIKTLVKYYAPWFEQVFPEYSPAPQRTKVSANSEYTAKVDSKQIDTCYNCKILGFGMNV